MTMPDRESREDVAAYQARGGPADELSGQFTGRLRCDRVECQQEYAIAGDWAYSVNDVYPEDGPQFIDMFKVRYVAPTLPMFSPPPAVPDTVNELLVEAASIVWSSPSGAANRLRQAVDQLLTERGVPRYALRPPKGTPPKRSRRSLTLHERITRFQAMSPAAAEALEAAKWIGNGGSHDGDLDVADVLNGVDFIALALRYLYDTTDTDLMRKARSINKARRYRPGR
ncbi:hypothetical protein JOE58_002616 [Curtobacterium luteum]|uniref:DUF4145 domain-containing protein n=1 Tax=Curtobacterium luteum TaxID=33881 RepID=A0ABS2RWG6_9MICO|nr:hypothetical protein [Curtobacterium luteum]NUU51607.1 DUF4145 domain-containing protein [Curtobacterium luteum]